MSAEESNELIHPRLEDFHVTLPPLKNSDYDMLIESSARVRSAFEEMMKFRPSNAPMKVLGTDKSETVTEDFSDDENQTSETFDNISSDILEREPSIAPPASEVEYPPESEFKPLIKKHDLERFQLSEDFRRQENIIQSNFYDAQLRENTQMNEMVNKRPISEALRYISKRISYPIDMGNQRFYKYNIRFDKIVKKHKKTLNSIHQIHETQSEVLYNSQFQEVIAVSDSGHIPFNEVRIPKVFSDNMNDNN